MDKKQLISTAIAGVMALGFNLIANQALAQGKAAPETGTCKQSNDCKGKGGCASLDGKHSCGGKNDCGNHKFKSTKADCDKHGGKWEPMAKK